MKRYILFFISIGLIIVTVFTFSIVNVEKSKQLTFSEAGYILQDTSERYYFLEEDKYTISYNEQIVFNDTEGMKVTVNSDKFLHYTSGNIEALQDGVLLDLSQINNNPIIYYNISANKEIKKISNRYTVKNLNDDLSFEQAIWKISATKYIILSDHINLILNNGTTKEIDGYIEIEYSDNEIVSIYNQEISYQTISSNSYVELDNDIKINLGTKIVSENDENKMSLEDMVINSDDNVTLIDLTDNKGEDKEDNTDEDQNTVDNQVQSGGQTANNNSSTVINNNDATTIITGNNVTTNNSDNNITNNGNNDSNNNNNSTNTNVIDIETAEILYEYISDNESKVDETISQTEPVFKLENMVVSSVGLSGNIQITDEEDILSKNDNIIIKIVNNSTGKIVYLDEESYGTFSIPVNVETLSPNTSYTIVASATYTLNDSEYSKNFIYKTFVTSEVGIDVTKDAYTNKSVSYNIQFKDTAIESAEVYLLDSNGNEMLNRSQIIRNTGTNSTETVTFEELDSDTKYIIKVANITYNGIIQEGTNWTIYNECKTLKNKASINELNYSINKRESTFTLYVENVTDTDNSIEYYTYYVYELVETTDEEGNVTHAYDTTNILYERETTNKEISITVADAEDEEANIVRDKYYGFKVIATTYDNEKYVEIESNLCGAMGLLGQTFPTVKFSKTEVTPTRICGNIYILDSGNTLIVDDENPLTITYYSNVDEVTTLGSRITDLSTYKRITDSDGNELIEIPIDLGDDGNKKTGLKSDTSYTFSVYGTIDLRDGNGEYENTYIGSSIVTTAKYSNITAELTTENVEKNAFTVDLKLSGDDIAKDSLTSVTLLLYEGSGDISTGEYKNWKRTITASNYSEVKGNVKKDENTTEINSLQDLLFNNTLMISPSFIGGGSESSYTELKYQVLVTMTVDGTEYENKIPITVAKDDDENTDNTTYKKNGETYSAAYIIVDGKGTQAPINEDTATIQATEITNKIATSYGIEKDSDLDDYTCVGYYVSTGFKNTGSQIAESITYYVWDYKGNPVKDENGENLTRTINFSTQDSAPTTVFEVGYGTLDDIETDNKTGMHRGEAYFFSYTVTYIDSDGKETVWPVEAGGSSGTEYTIKSLKTDILYPNKQAPSFVFYPVKSTNKSITYKYSCKDLDNALKYSSNSTGDYTYLTLTDGLTEDDTIAVKTNGEMEDLTLASLQAGKKYTLSYSRNLNKVRSSQYASVELFKQLFEGVVSCDTVKITDVMYDTAKPNNIQIQLDGDNINRIAAVKVTFTNGNATMQTKLLQISNDNGYYIDVDLMELKNDENFKNFIGTDASISITIYYDNGKIGFEQNDGTIYATYVNQDNQYLKLGENGFVLDSTNSSINGKLFIYNFETNNTRAILGIKDIDNINDETNGRTLYMQYSPAGFVQNGSIIIQKEIEEMNINANKTITINNLRIGIQIDNIETTLSTASISATVINPTNDAVKDNEIIAEIWHSPNKSDIPNWSDCSIIKLKISNNKINIDLDNLKPAEYYYMKLKYVKNDTDLYTYDAETKEIGRVYEFETLATIGIKNLTVQYKTENYIDKYLDINYSVNELRSNMYSSTKYEFFEEDGKTKVELTDDNIIVTNSKTTYQIIDGNLIVANNYYETDDLFENVNEKISLSPTVNIFTMGKKYTLKITPIILLDSNESYEIESETVQFETPNLNEPTVGIKMTRKETESNIKYIKTTITINDVDNIIYGSKWGEYQINVYRYQNDISKKAKVDIYSKYMDGTVITGQTFNLQENATNFSVYVQNKDIDYTYNYVAEITFKEDIQNKGLEKTKTRTETYTLKAIENEQEISIGSVMVVKNGENTEMRFYDSYYNITKINRIDYTVYNLDNNNNKTGSFVPTWIRVEEDATDVTYYKINLPISFSEGSTYAIKANLYADNSLVGQVDITYINK
jgi:hypothetical protein